MTTRRHRNKASAAPSVDLRGWSGIGEREHAVQFYAEDRHLIELLTRYVGTALVSGDVAIVIATRPHREALTGALKRRGMNLSIPQTSGAFVMLDAAATLGRFMRDGRLDARLFRETLGAKLLGITERWRPTGRRVMAFGEMVALLWAYGNPDSAIRLEELWNRLAQQCAFTLCCAYPITAFNDAETGSFLRICAQHSHVFAAQHVASIARLNGTAPPDLSAPR